MQAIVVGSGFGGLAAAARLVRKGYSVTLLEARDQLGGRAGVFRDAGFTFDAGPTVITAPYLITDLFEMLDENPLDYFELRPIDPFYRILFNDGSSFDYVGDQERLLENIRKLSPADVHGYARLAEHAERIFKVGYQGLADTPFPDLRSMLRVLPDMIRLENYRTVYGLVSKYIKDERLRQALSFEPLLVGGNPHSITSIYLLIHWLERKWGVHYVMGGTTALVRAFERLLEKKGVRIEKSCSVDRLTIDGGKIREVHAGGKSFKADLVVANADPVRVYRDWIDPKFRRKHSDRSLNRKTFSMSLFVAYFGTKKTFPDLAHHTIILGPRYKGLLDDIFKRKVLAEDFSLYLHAPTRTDPSMAPPGHECFYVLSPVPNSLSGINWKEEGPRYWDRILNRLDQTLLPGLKANLVTEFFVTPDYCEKDLQSEKGAAFGIEPSLTQSAYFRFHNQSEDINNLYFVGAGTHPGAGIPGVLNSARVLERLIPDLGSR